MAENLIQFIERRRGELAAEEAVLRQKINEIQVEIASLDKVEASFLAETQFNLKKQEGRRVVKVIKPNTIMSKILKILEKKPYGLIALDILAELNRGNPKPLLRTSLSPQLSRLKQSGYIELDGSAWRLIK